jgi:hypothetical protein
MPVSGEFGALATMAQQAHNEGMLQGVLLSWAERNGLAVVGYYAGSDHLFPFGAVAVGFRKTA